MYGNNAAPYKPDTNNPEIFVLRSSAPPSISYLDVPLRFNWDGKQHRSSIDINGESVALLYTPSRISLAGGGYDWEVVVQFDGAAMRLGKPGEARIAPQNGYEKILHFKRGWNGRNSSAMDPLVYIKTNKGTYAELQFNIKSDLDMDSKTGAITIRWNNEGGRIFD